MADTIEGLATAKDTEIWHAHNTAPQKYHIWAPELHKIGNDWYIYYAASIEDNEWKIRSFVLKCAGGKNITQKENWEEQGQFKDEKGNAFDKMTLDMTYFTVNSKHYVIWAEKPNNVSYLKMGEIDSSKPAQLKSAPIILTTPEYDWEQAKEKVNEGPAVFIKDNKVYVTYSAAATGDEYCVGMLTADTSSDLMNTNSWTKSQRPVLSSADISGQYGPGHNSFFEGADGKLMIIYHARDERCHSDNCDYSNKEQPLYDPCRNAIVQEVRWKDGNPVFTGSAVRDIDAKLRNITATVNVGNIKAEDKVKADLDAIVIPNENNIKGNITLLTEGPEYKSKITWVSDNETVIKTDGIVTRQSTDITVKLTATATLGEGADAVTATREFTLTVKKAPEKKSYAGYLFAYFTGQDSANDEQFYFATSQDGLKWEQWNDGEPAKVSTMGEKGLRDPFIIRSPEGDKFYLIATDLRIYGNGNWTAAQESGSKSIMIWESDDLIEWSDQRMVEVATEGAGCTWAPEAFYNDTTGEYMVFWSSKIPQKQDVENNDYTHRVYYATTRDFYTFSEPQVWIELHNPSGKTISVIDATVIKVGNTYYRFIKNEATEAHADGKPSTGKYTILQQSDSLTGNWTDIDSNINDITGVEGATCFKFNGEDKWCLLLDDNNNGGYFPLTTTDLAGGQFTKLADSDYSFPSTMRHGTVLPLTQDEYDKFCPKSTVERWDDADTELTYDGEADKINKDPDAGGSYYMGTLTTLSNGWQDISHQTKGEKGTKNAFYYYKKDGSTWGSNGDNAWSGEKDSYYEIVFEGTDIELYALCNKDNKTGTVYIDKEPAGAIDCSSQSTAKKKVFEKTGLENGKHTVKVVVDEEGGYISAAGARVRANTGKNPSVSGTFTGTGFAVIGPGSKGTYKVAIDSKAAETYTVSNTVEAGKAAVKVYNIGDADTEHTFRIEVEDGVLCVDAVDIHKVYDPDAPVEDYDLKDAKAKLKKAVDTYVLTDEERAGKSPSSLEKYDEAYKYARKALEDTSWGEQTAERILSYYNKLEKKWKGLQEKGTPVHYTSISGTNGDIWLDTDGTEIQAHGGQVLPVKQEDGSTIYYWYGEDKTDGYRTVDGGVRVYSSTDLYNWKSEGIALRDLTDKYDFEEDYFKELYGDYTQEQKDRVLLGINDSTSVIERPKVIYNEKNNNYVMWFHADGPTETSTANYAAASAGVAVSDSPTGPFRYINRYRLHYVHGGYDQSKGMSRDMNLFVDDDKKAYIIYSSEENYSMFISLLNDDYTGLAVPDTDAAADTYDEATGKGDGFNAIKCLYKAHREAPAMFKYQGRYYLMTSGATGWGANRADYVMCEDESPLGVWKEMGDPCVTDKEICKYDNSITFGTQSTNILAVDAQNGKFIYMGDRWNNKSPAGNDLIDPKYVWLPVCFKSNGEMVIYPKNDWTLDDLGQVEYTVELKTELPAAIDRGSLNKLPGKVEFIFADETETSRVQWTVKQGDLDCAGSLVTVTGTLIDFKNGTTAVSAQCLVVSEDMQYFVDCGVTADSGHTSEIYDQARAAVSGLRNGTADAAYTEGSTWGVDMDTVDGAVNYSASNGKLCETGYYGKNDGSKNVTYYLTLDKGEYTLLSGHHEWWNADRTTDIKLSYTKEDGSAYNETLGTVRFQWGGDADKQFKKDFTVDHDGTVVALTFAKGDGSSAAGTIAYFAVSGRYEAPADVTVTFDTKGGSEVDPVSARTGSRLSDLAVKAPVRKGFVFRGWYKDADCQTPWDYDTDLITADMTLYAYWEEAETEYTVTFDTKGGSAVAPVKCVEGSRLSDLNIETPTKDGYKFTGWYKDEACKVAWDDETDQILKDTTLYAGWKEDKTEPEPTVECTVTFNTMGGSTIDAIRCTQGSKLADLNVTAPVKEGYLFTGWYKDEACTMAWDDEKDTITSDITLYAGWNRIVREGLWIAPVESAVYTGKAIKPDVVVYNGETKLTIGRDYTVTYKNNVNVYVGGGDSKRPQAIVKGKNDYTDSAVVYFEILPKQLSDQDIMISNIYAAANDKNRAPKSLIPSVQWGTKQLKYSTTEAKSDYTVAVPSSVDYTKEGMYTITITGRGNYAGIREARLTVSTKTFLDKASVKGVKNMPYTGKSVTFDNLSVKLKKKALTKDVDYTVSYENNVQAGTGMAVITGIGDYAGEKRVAFKIYGRKISKAKVTGITDVGYTGNAISQKNFKVMYGSDELREGTDFKVSYQNNVKAGKATVIFTGINGYSGTKNQTYRILPYDITSGGNFKLRVGSEGFYRKKGAHPQIQEITFNGETLTEDIDYRITSTKAKKIGAVASYEIRGIGSFTGKMTGTFTVTQGNLSESGMAIHVKDYTRKSSKDTKYRSVPVITDADGSKLKAGRDYTLRYLYDDAEGAEITSGSLEAGRVIYVEASGKGNYAGDSRIGMAYRIIEGRQDIARAKVTVDVQTYTGQPIELNKDAIHIRMKGASAELRSGDFEIIQGTYQKNIKKGTAKVIIRGIGAYGGEKQISFKIKAGNIKNAIW